MKSRRGCALLLDILQMGSLAGAAYLLHDNAGVLRQAQRDQKSLVAHKGKGFRLILEIQYFSRL